MVKCLFHIHFKGEILGRRQGHGHTGRVRLQSFPSRNWYGRVLTLVGLVAKSTSIETLTSVVTIGYLHAKDDCEEAKALRIVPFLAMSNFDTNPESDCDMPNDE